MLPSAPQKISHLVVSINAEFIDDTHYERIAKLQNNVTQSGSQIPGANKLHPMKLSANIELSIAPEVTAELNHWSEKLGI